MHWFLNNILPILAALTAPSLAGAVAPRASFQPVTIKGNAFFAGNDRFYVRGVDYQPGRSIAPLLQWMQTANYGHLLGGSSNLVDPIADPVICKRDIVEFKKLKINTIRVYSVDNSKNHDECMNALKDAGIYLALDVNTPKYSIRQDKPAQSYNGVYLQNVFATVDAFAKYDNTLLFFSGNEVINNVATSVTARWVKAVGRDIKQYIGTRGYRKIPVGYSAADIDDNRLETAHYMNCGTDDSRVDFFAFNDYSWCNPSSFTTSTWSDKVKAFSDYSIPIFLSEYGCVKTARTWDEITTLYSSQMTPVYSGGLVYEYTEEGDATQNKYGLVEVSGNSVTELPDFATLQKAFTNVSPPSGDGGYKASGSASQCPPKSQTFLEGTNDLPAIPESALKYFKSGAGTGAGFEGTGSQDVGAESTGTATAGSGAVTNTSAAKKGDAGSSLRAPDMAMAPLVCGMVMVLFTLVGASLL